jgi:hypothetical protein
MSIIGHNPANLIDCSDVIPAAPPLPANAGPHLPAGQTQRNIQQAVRFAESPVASLTQILDSAIWLRSRPSLLSRAPQPLFLQCTCFPLEMTTGLTLSPVLRRNGMLFLRCSDRPVICLWNYIWFRNALGSHIKRLSLSAGTRSKKFL